MLIFQKMALMALTKTGYLVRYGLARLVTAASWRHKFEVGYATGRKVNDVSVIFLCTVVIELIWRHVVGCAG